MIDFNRVAKRIFNILKGHGYQLKVFTAVGDETIDPEEGRNFYIFEPTMMLTLDDSNGEIILNKPSSIELATYEDVLRQCKNLSNHYMLRFNIKNYGKDLQPKHFSTQAKKNKKDKEMNTVVENRMFGSKKTSYQVVEGVRILVRHRKDIDEGVRGSRSRNIQAIFLEQNGERLRFPTNHLGGARAMARHLVKGGSVSDVIGEHIVTVSKNYVKLCEFMRYVSSNKLLTENTDEIVSTIKENLINMSSELKQLSGSRSYDLVASRIEESKMSSFSDEEINGLREMFTVKRFDEKLTDVLPIVNQLVQNKNNMLTKIQEAAEGEIFVRKESPISEEGIEYVSEMAKFGNRLVTLSSRIIENSLLSNYILSIGKKVIAEEKLSKFEENIIRTVLENCKIKEEVKTNPTISDIVESYSNALGKYEYGFILEDLQNVVTEEELSFDSLLQKAREIGSKIRELVQISKEQGIMEFRNTEGPDMKNDIQEELLKVVFKYEAAKKGLSLINKLKNKTANKGDPTIKRHASRVMKNLNELYGDVQRLEKIIKSSPVKSDVVGEV